MTARNAVVLFLVGTPLCLVVLVALGHSGSAWPRRAVVRVRRERTVARDAPAPGDVAEPSVVGSDAPTTAAPAAPVARPRLTRALVASVRPPRPVQAPWAPGDGLRHPLASGDAPGEATVRKRAWTSYATIADPATYGPANLERLERGRPPLRFHPIRGELEAMEVDVDAVGHARISWPDADRSVDPFAVTR